MAGMTAAAFAAESGLAVLVVEKHDDIGGSARLSGGGFWTAADYATLREINPLGDPEQGRALIQGYEQAGEFIARLGTAVTPCGPYLGTQSFPAVIRHVDIPDYLKRARACVQNAGGWIVTRALPRELLHVSASVVGALVENAGELVEVRARSTLLATGGFQNDGTLRARYLGPNATDIVVRSNPMSDGQGLRLGMSVGADISEHMTGWYGHTVPYPVERPLAPGDFLPLAQFYLSPRGLLLNRQAARFTDESLGYYLNAQAVLDQPQARALLLFDEALRAEDTERYGVDRFEFAVRRGAHAVKADDWATLARCIEEWGYFHVHEALESYDRALREDLPLNPPRQSNRRRLCSPPFFAVEVQPAITFTHGGLRIDTHARVLTSQGLPIDGLLAAGADAGGTYHRAYAGGLAMAAVFGIAAARTAIAASHLRALES
jgi:succinate dehydrogenase/fumarate reductase flavoprotein subunit